MLTRLAVQLCAVQALKGATIVGANVRDSEVGVNSLDQDGNIATTEQKPFVNVFSEDANATGGRLDLLGQYEFVQDFQFGVTSAMPLITGEGDYLLDAETEDILLAERVKPSDADINVLLAVIERQIGLALMDPDNAWASLWQRFWIGEVQIKSSRGQSRADGVRFGARQMSVAGQLLAEPGYGMDVRPGSAWHALLEQLPGSEIEHLAETFERLIGTDDPRGDLAFFQRRYGHGTAAADALGYGLEGRNPDQPIIGSDITDVGR